MKIDFNIPLKGLDGVDMTDVDGQPYLLKTFVVNALLAPPAQGEKIAGDVKVRRWNTAQNVHSADGEVDLSVEEVAEIKKLVGDSYPPMVVGQLWKLLD